MARFRTKTISRRTVDALKVDKDTMFWDRELPGFGVRVYPSGRKVYIVQTRAAGKAGLRVTIGPDGVISPEEARRRAALIIARIKAGEEPVPEPMSAKLAKGPTVAELARRYLEDHVAVRCRPSTAELYRVAVEKYIFPRFGKQPAIAIDHAQVTELHHALRDKPVMANKVVETLSRIYNAAEDKGLIPEGSNPCGLVVKNRERKRERFLTPDEFRRLGRALAEATTRRRVSPYAVAAIRLLILTGCRKREILHLRWEQVDLEGAEFVLPATKTGPRKVSLSPRGSGSAEEHRPDARQSLGDTGQDRGTTDAQHRRGLGGGLRARGPQGHTHPRLPSQFRVPRARFGREPPDDRAPPRAFRVAGDGALCASRQGLGSRGRGADLGEYRG